MFENSDDARDAIQAMDQKVADGIIYLIKIEK